jgi:hypothetical protein
MRDKAPKKNAQRRNVARVIEPLSVAIKEGGWLRLEHSARKKKRCSSQQGRAA